jgi:hypothetical protein
VLFNAGRRLFEPHDAQRQELRCARVLGSEGVTHLRYQVVR